LGDEVANIDGTSNHDSLVGTPGADVIRGFAGDDYLGDELGGADILDGGDGDDSLGVFRNSQMVAATVTLTGGVGDDSVSYRSFINASSAILDAGDGNDRVFVQGAVEGAARVVLGNGSDVLALGSWREGLGYGHFDITVTDFQPGLSGDQLEWSQFLEDNLYYWDGSNPFNSGYMRLVQSGTDTLLQQDRDGGGNKYATLITFENLNAAELLDSNFDVFAPTWIYGTQGSDNLLGSTGGDHFRAEAGDDTVQGYAGDDILFGGSGNDNLAGGEGDDVLNGGLGYDTLNGGGGIDTADYSDATFSILLFLSDTSSQNTGGAGYDRLSGIENIIGSAFNDTLIGNDLDNVLTGGPGNDLLNGGAGTDTASYATATSGVVVDLHRIGGQDTGGAGADALLLIENVTGSAFEDNLIGSAVANVLDGGIGNDRLVGYAGNDTLDGGMGIDIMRGGQGDDMYYVDNAKDNPIENAGEGTDTVHSSISYALAGNIENLDLSGSAIRGSGNSLDNRLVGTDGANIIDGGAGADTMRGGLGDDRYYIDNAGDRAIEDSGAGRDRVYTTISLTLDSNLEDLFARGSDAINLTGNALDNTLRGNSAANILTGGAGADDLRGGTGADTFVFRDGDFAGLTPSTSDRIIDFSHSEGDRIDLRQVDADSGLDGTQHFSFIGSDSFHNVAGELRYEIINGNTYVYGDTNGDGLADLMIRLDGSHALVSGNFIVG
jgi:Ca2+-binding RTX toxin-like protein